MIGNREQQRDRLSPLQKNFLLNFSLWLVVAAFLARIIQRGTVWRVDGADRGVVFRGVVDAGIEV
jgi:hypothetical protein